MTKLIFLFCALACLSNCSKKEPKNPEKDLYTRDGIWYYSAFTIDGADSTKTLIDTIVPTERSLKFQFYKISGNKTPMFETIDYEVFYAISGDKFTVSGRTQKGGPCAFIRRGVEIPFQLPTSVDKWNFSSATDEQITFTAEHVRYGIKWSTLSVTFTREMPNLSRFY